LSPKFMEEYTDAENKLLQKQKAKTRVELLEEEFNQLNSQIDTLKATHAQEIEEMRGKHAQEIQRLTQKHSEEMLNLLLRKEDLDKSLA
ncbi:hypothetical protein MKX03_002693, partial [Papaver bracteatum]